MSKSALVMFSGGQDSTTCLAWALSRYERVDTIGFHYGQRHAVEMTVREPILDWMGLHYPNQLGSDVLLTLDLKGITRGALLDDGALKEATGGDGFPSTYVPGRNLLFMTYAAVVAAQRGNQALVGGMCETDFSGYPDCRDNTLKAMQVAVNLGMATNIRIETPLMWIDKAQTWAMAMDLGGNALVKMIQYSTHTCYAGDREHQHVWGFGCGECAACNLRANGYRKWHEAYSADIHKKFYAREPVAHLSQASDRLSDRLGARLAARIWARLRDRLSDRLWQHQPLEDCP